MAVLKKGEKKILKKIVGVIQETIERSEQEELEARYEDPPVELTPVAEVAKTGRVKKKDPVPVEEKKIYRTYEDYDFEDLQVYAGIDCLVTSELLARQFPVITKNVKVKYPDKYGSLIQCEAPATIDSIIGIEKQAMEFLIDLEINGIKYDIAKNREIDAAMYSKLQELEEGIFARLPERINLDSGVQVADMIYRRMGYTVLQTTKTGEPATDGAAFLELAGLDKLGLGGYVAAKPEDQFLALLSMRKDINGCRNTFVKTYVEDFVKRDGRVHSPYSLHGTSSFRLSGGSSASGVVGSNLTQLPRPKHGFNVRDCFIVEEGMVFIAADFSSAEVKILANVSKDENMLRAVAENRDFHSSSASLMLGIPYEEFMDLFKNGPLDKRAELKLLRQVAKVLTFSILYGSSAGGIAFQLNITLEKAEEYMQMFFKAYPGLRKFIDESYLLAKTNLRVWTPFGQAKHVYGAAPAFRKMSSYNASLRSIGNFRIQSTTSTLGLAVFSKINEEIKKFGAKSIATVYDSIEIECPLENAAAVVDLVFYYMNEWPVEQFDWLQLPVGCDVEVSKSWGGAEHVHRGITQEEIEEMYPTMK